MQEILSCIHSKEYSQQVMNLGQKVSLLLHKHTSLRHRPERYTVGTADNEGNMGDIEL
jgi:hypothetical protein